MATTTAAPVQRHVFIIDDETAILELFREMLEDEGYRVTCESFFDRDLAHQQARIEEVKPDVLVLDLVIGGEPFGWKLLQMLKMKATTAHLPVIVCSAAVQTLNGLESHLAAMGVSVVLKPFEVDQFLDVVKRTLNAGDRAQQPSSANARHDTGRTGP